MLAFGGNIFRQILCRFSKIILFYTSKLRHLKNTFTECTSLVRSYELVADPSEGHLRLRLYDSHYLMSVFNTYMLINSAKRSICNST